MLNSKSFLAVDFGAANLKLAEFDVNEAGGLLLRQYGFRSLGRKAPRKRPGRVRCWRACKGSFRRNAVRLQGINVCAPGFHTFSKFVKLPPVDTSKVTQIIQYEAQQNVPFPLEEVVWDYQILGADADWRIGSAAGGDQVGHCGGLVPGGEAAGLRLQLVDVSPAALCNAFRYNYGDLEGCTMLLDIGAKTSNLLFFREGESFLPRASTRGQLDHAGLCEGSQAEI